MRCIFQSIEPSVYETVPLWSLLAPQCVAWHSEDKPFAAGYPDGKILLASTETYENEQPVVLCVFQVCFQNALGTYFNSNMLQNKHNLKHVIPLSVYIWDFSYRLLHSYCPLCTGRCELSKMGPDRSLAALLGEVRGGEDTGTLFGHLGDTPHPHSQQHC